MEVVRLSMKCPEPTPQPDSVTDLKHLQHSRSCRLLNCTLVDMFADTLPAVIIMRMCDNYTSQGIEAHLQ